MADIVYNDFDQMLNQMIEKTVNAIMDDFDRFMKEAACAKKIREKGMVEEARAVFTAGYSAGWKYALDTISGGGQCPLPDHKKQP